MVSRAGSEEIVPGIANADHVASYVSRHTRDVARRGYYLGAWAEDTPEGGKQTVFDISQRMPKVSANLQGAIHNQRAVFDVNAGDVREVQPVLPYSDINRFDVEEIHAPKIRHRTEVFGEIERRRRQASSSGGAEPTPLPFTANARRRIGMV
jgi:hypothetical protein